MPSISVVIRFRNEIRYIAAVLSAVRAQGSVGEVEIIAVDNSSTDGSREVAVDQADKILDISDYRPGVALNRAVEACSGDLVVVLSAHAVPAHDRWLEILVRPLRNPGVLGVYGAQVYPSTARFLDKRDLDIFSDPDPRSEFSDSDFWNANSAFRRIFWEERPFDEDVIELEDHHWTKQSLPGTDRWVRFEPDALVYHYGHESRNDRAFLPPAPVSPTVRIDRALAVLRDSDAAWPTVMTAGMVLGSLDKVPETARAVPVLGEVLLGHPDFDVRWRMASALGRIGGAEAVPFLLAGLADRSFYPRDECAWSLGRVGRQAVAGLLQACDTADEVTLPFLGLALGLTGDPQGRLRAGSLLARCAAADDPAVARDAVYFRGELGTDVAAAVDNLSALVAAPDHRLARAAAYCWGRIRTAGEPPDVAGLVGVGRGHAFDTVRAEAVTALGHLAAVNHPASLITELGRVLDTDPAGNVRYAALQALRIRAEHGDEDARAIAGCRTEHEDFGVRFEQRLLSSTGRASRTTSGGAR